jgi:hypothetical protein
MLIIDEKIGNSLQPVRLSSYPIIKISYKVNKGNWSGWINTADTSPWRIILSLFQGTSVKEMRYPIQGGAQLCCVFFVMISLIPISLS